MWRVWDLITFGAFESKVPEDKKRDEDMNKTAISRPLEPPVSENMQVGED